MTTTIDYALMAGASYISNRPDINRFPVPSGWNEREDKRQSLPSGFEATYFVKGSEIVISFAGTNFENKFADFTYGNFPLAFGELGQQLKDAADYYLQIKAANPAAHITLTGHSLGGGLAALIAVMFDETAVTFDQAPFNKSAMFFNSQPKPITGEVTTTSVAQALRSYLADHATSAQLAKLDAYIAANASTLNPIPAQTVTRSGNVTNFSTQGEILSADLFSNGVLVGKTGVQNNISYSHADVSPLDLHSMSLLIAMLQSGDTATSTSDDHTLGQVSFKLKDLIKILFDGNLFAYSVYNDNQDNPNFLEHIVQHQAGGKAVNATETIAADAMVTRFTADLWKLAQEGGLTISDGLSDSTINNVSKALTAFAMQFYYEDTANATDASKQLFKDLNAGGPDSNGVQFDIADVSKDIKAAIDAGQDVDLSQAKGYKEFFSKYINDIAKFTIEEQKLIQGLLPTLRDWYVQANVNGMTATDTLNRGAFMLGGATDDNLTGGTADDLLIGNAGDDTLSGDGGVDLLIGGIGNDTLDGGEGNDGLRGGTGYDLYKFSGTFGIDIVKDEDSQGEILVDGQTLSGGSYKQDNIYKDDITGYTSIKVNGGQGLVILKEGDANRIIVNNWSETNNFGINLTGEAPAAPQVKLSGDYAKKTFFSELLGLELYEYDAGYNYISAGPQPNAPDQLQGSDSDNVIDGGGGSDFITGNGGNDYIMGGTEGDFIQGGLGKDTLLGGDGADLIYGSSQGYPTLEPRPDFDMPEFNYPNITATGFNWYAGYATTYTNGVPKYYLSDNTDRNRVAGDGGNDVIYGDGNINDGDSIVWAEAATHGNDIIDGGDGEDIIVGQGGDDIIFGGSGADQLAKLDAYIAANASTLNPIPAQTARDFAANDMIYNNTKEREAA